MSTTTPNGAGSTGRRVATCACGVETFLAGEWDAAGFRTVEQGVGWGLVEESRPGAGRAAAWPLELCFGRMTLLEPEELRAGSASQLRERLCECFCRTLGDEKVDAPWTLWMQPAGDPAEGARQSAEGFVERLKKCMSRVAKLGVEQEWLPVGTHRGFFALMLPGHRAFASRTCFSGGQRRMRFAEAAPSRSYLKVEEAYQLLGVAPAEGEIVVDLGAAPGGWSYSAAQRGARVIAIDNGRLKAGSAAHPLIEHRQADAFTYRPGQDGAADWLFCDVVDNPRRVFELLLRWLDKGACRRFVVNLKFGRDDVLRLLAQVRDPRHGLPRYCQEFRVRQLYHDREEITLVGEIAHAGKDPARTGHGVPGHLRHPGGRSV